jgi:structural maintenance of chromosome 2
LQFVVVSLKEGMFNNADVIFRTKFVDGVSAVTRTVPAKQREKEREHRPVPVTPGR